MQTLDSKQEERQLLLRNTSEKNGKQYEKGRKIERKFKRITMTPCSSKGIEWQSRRQAAACEQNFFFFFDEIYDEYNYCNDDHNNDVQLTMMPPNAP